MAAPQVSWAVAAGLAPSRGAAVRMLEELRTAGIVSHVEDAYELEDADRPHQPRAAQPFPCRPLFLLGILSSASSSSNSVKEKTRAARRE